MLKKLLNCLPKHHFVLWPTMNDDTCFSIFPSAFCIFSILDLTFLIGIGWYIIIILIWSFLVILNIFLSLLGIYIYTSVQFSHPVVSDSLWPHKSKHARPPCPSPTPGVYSNSCPSSWWCHPTISSCRPLLLPSIRVFSNEPALRIRWPKDWSFSFSISPSSEHPGLISFRMDWLDLLAVQGTLKNQDLLSSVF